MGFRILCIFLDQKSNVATFEGGGLHALIRAGLQQMFISQTEGHIYEGNYPCFGSFSHVSILRKFSRAFFTAIPRVVFNGFFKLTLFKISQFYSLVNCETLNRTFYIKDNLDNLLNTVYFVKYFIVKNS